MKILLFIASIIGFIVVYCNVVATICAIRTDCLERNQKIFQLLIIWLLPVIGALFVIHLITGSDPEAFPAKFVPQKINWCFVWAYSDSSSNVRSEDSTCASSSDSSCNSEGSGD